MSGPIHSGNLPDDITILNSHYFPESLPSSTVSSIKRSKECQKRLEELLLSEKIDSGKKSGEILPGILSGKPDIARERKEEELEKKEFPQEKPPAYWSCGFSEGFFTGRYQVQNNAVIKLIKMFLP